MRFLKFAFFASVIVFLFSIFYHNIIDFDQDLGRHLLMGKIISSTGSVPNNNLLSYTQPSFKFVNSHWLSEVVFYQIDQMFGIMSLLYLKTIVLTAAFSLTIFSAYRYCKNLVATALSFVVLAPILLERTDIRPEMFSFLFVAIFLFVLFRHSRATVLLGTIKGMWILPIIEIFWVNMHIYFILGPILVGIFLIQKIWGEHQIGRNAGEIFQNNRLEILIAILVFAATFVNPNGIVGATYPLHVFDNYGYSIVENQNIFFLKDLVFNPNIFFFEMAAAFFALSFVSTDWKRNRILNLLLAGMAVLPFMAIRNFPLFFLIELPVIAWNLTNMNPLILKRVHHFFARFGEKNDFRIARVLIVLVVCITLIRTVRLMTNDYYLSVDSNKRFGSEIADSGKGAMDFVAKNNLHGPMFNNFDVGSYIAYRTFPKNRVFVDGRPEAYPAQFFQGVYIPMQTNSENFKTVDGIYKFNFIVFSHTDATPWGQDFLGQIINNPDYSLVYFDSYAVVFVRKSKFPNLIAASLDTKQINSSSYLDNLSYAQLFSLFGRNDLAAKYLKIAYGQNSNSSTTLLALGRFYSQNPATTILGQNYLKQYKNDLGPAPFNKTLF